MNEMKYLLAKGFKFEEIAQACGLSLLAVCCAYNGTYVHEVREVYNHYRQTGHLPLAPQPTTEG